MHICFFADLRQANRSIACRFHKQYLFMCLCQHQHDITLYKCFFVRTDTFSIEKEAEESKESPVESETSVCGRLYNIIMRAMLQEIHIYVETQSCLTVFIPYDNVPQNDLSKNVSHKNKRVGMIDSLKNYGLCDSVIFDNRYFSYSFSHQ